MDPPSWIERRTIKLRFRFVVYGDYGLRPKRKSSRGRLERGGEKLVINAVVRIYAAIWSHAHCCMSETRTGPDDWKISHVGRQFDLDAHDIGAINLDRSSHSYGLRKPYSPIGANEITVVVAYQ